MIVLAKPLDDEPEPWEHYVRVCKRHHKRLEPVNGNAIDKRTGMLLCDLLRCSGGRRGHLVGPNEFDVVDDLTGGVVYDDTGNV